MNAELKLYRKRTRRQDEQDDEVAFILSSRQKQ